MTIHRMNDHLAIAVMGLVLGVAPDALHEPHPRPHPLPAAQPLPASRASGSEAPGPWAWVRTITPPEPEPLAFGPAIAADGGTLWIGPARDDDVGDGPPAVTAVALCAGPGLPTAQAWTVRHPALDRGASFGAAIAAAGGIAVSGAPSAGCGGGACDTGQAFLATCGHDGPRSVAEVACPGPRERAEFGGAVAVDGSTAAIGSPREGGIAWDAGAVDVFDVDAAAGTARHRARLVSPAPTASGRFGAALAVDGGCIAIGEPGAHGSGPDTLDSGAVHLATLVGGSWSITHTLRAPAGDGGWFGASLALAGDDLLVGAPIAASPDGTRCGSVRHYRRSGGAWMPHRVLRHPAPEPGAAFGSSVAARDGWFAVGAPGDDREGEDAGAAFAGDLRSGRLRRLHAPSRAAGTGLGAGLAFGEGTGRPPTGPRRFLAVSGRRDPELSPVPGAVELFGMREPEPVLLAGGARAAPTPAPGAGQPVPQPSAASAGAHSRSASAIAIAADASVTRDGAQPAATSRASASGP